MLIEISLAGCWPLAPGWPSEDLKAPGAVIGATEGTKAALGMQVCRYAGMQVCRYAGR